MRVTEHHRDGTPHAHVAVVIRDALENTTSRPSSFFDETTNFYVERVSFPRQRRRRFLPEAWLHSQSPRLLIQVPRYVNVRV